MNNSLALPTDPAFDFSALDRADIQPSTRIKYHRALDNMLAAGVDPFDYDRLSAYADSLSPSARGFLKAALKLSIDEKLTRIKSRATPQNIAAVQAFVARVEAMGKTIKIHESEGEKSHLWLTPEQVKQITSLPDWNTVQGRRDWLVLALLLSGLRREEVASLTFDHLTKQPMSNGQMRAVLDVHGKGAKDRVVPIQSLLAWRIQYWKSEAGDGRVVRAINKGGKINGSLSTQAIYDIVAKYGAMIGLPQLQPHDLRRTYAQIGWDNTHDLVLIMTLLGHTNPETTRRYLNLKVNLDETISDYVPLS